VVLIFLKDYKNLITLISKNQPDESLKKVPEKISIYQDKKLFLVNHVVIITFNYQIKIMYFKNLKIKHLNNILILKENILLILLNIFIHQLQLQNIILNCIQARKCLENAVQVKVNTEERTQNTPVDLNNLVKDSLKV